MLARIQNNYFSRKTVSTALFVIAVFLFSFIFIAPELVSAAETDTFGLEQFGEQTALGAGDIRVIVARIIRAALSLLGIIAVGLIMYAGFTIMTSEGNEQKIDQGKKILTNAVIGLAIIMSSLAIVHFVLKAFENQGVPPGQVSGTEPVFDSFIGSGGLGSIIRDHYPFRDQTGVKRNEAISVTFAEPIDPATIIDDVQLDGIFGNCDTEAENYTPETHCDKVKQDAVEIHVMLEGPDDEKNLVEAAAYTMFEDGEEQNAYTFVFDPFEFLGEPGQEVWYTVILKKQIEKKNEVGGEKVSAFFGQKSDFYSWDFQTDGELDLTAPEVVNTHPTDGSVSARNTYIQINFSEAINPISIQGLVTAEKQAKNLLFNTLTDSGEAKPTGEWRISNGYRTVEFISDQACGQNSCGGILYCLPLTCQGADCSDNYSVAIRTAALKDKNAGTFESIKFTGVVDMAFNALDGFPNGSPEGKPPSEAVPGSTKEPADAKPDNYAWNFKIENKIDRSSPFIESTAPAIDKGFVKSNELLTIAFNRPMLFSSLYSPGIHIEEYPDDPAIDNLWYVPFMDLSKSSTKTVLDMAHRAFGPNDGDYYYFPRISSQILALNGNCYYPGRGPGGDQAGDNLTCEYQEDDDGVMVPGSDAGCVKVYTKSADGKSDPDHDTGCVIGSDAVEKAQPDIDTCLVEIKNQSPL